MGLIKTAIDSASSTLKDTYKDLYYCPSLDEEVLVSKGRKRGGEKGGFFSRKSDATNVVTNGSIISVADGQCMILVSNGEVIDVSAEPGEYRFDSGSPATIFEGSLGDRIKNTFSEIVERISYGSYAKQNIEIFYVNTKEIPGNKYGTMAPVPFRIVDKNIGLDIDIAIKCNGEYSYHIVNPILFYKNVCGNIDSDYERDEIDSQFRSELLTYLQPAFAKISEMGIRYSALPGHTVQLSNALNEVMSNKWRDLRGIEIKSFGVSTVKASAEDEKMIKELQRTSVFRNTNMAAAEMVNAQSKAMQAAGSNEGGAMQGFMGVNMANQAGGMNANDLFKMGAQEQTSNSDSWTCSKCNTSNTGKFCSNCGNPQPKNNQGWDCGKCGNTNNTGNFCANCGSPKPSEKVCPNCGEKIGENAKFCPSCGQKV